MTQQQYKNLAQALSNQLRSAKDDYKAGLIDIKTLQYFAKRLQHVEAQLRIEYTK